MNAVVEHKPHAIVQNMGRLSVQEVTQHAVTVQEVMRAVMKPDLHFGVIKGTDKPTLLQPGADVLCMTFRIAPEFITEDLSTDDAIRYRVTCKGIHQMSGTLLGSGIGEASTGEEKYRWRKAVCDEEWDDTPQNLRRQKYVKPYGKPHFTIKQIRTEPADLANTVLKMAAKRAKIAMVLNVTAASDMFGQDLEDLDAALREVVNGEDTPSAPTVTPAMEALRKEALAAAEAAKTADDLRKLGPLYTPKFREQADSAGYEQFKAAVQAKGTALREAQPKTATDVAAARASEAARDPIDGPTTQPLPAAGGNDERLTSLAAAEAQHQGGADA